MGCRHSRKERPEESPAALDFQGQGHSNADGSKGSGWSLKNRKKMRRKEKTKNINSSRQAAASSSSKPKDNCQLTKVENKCATGSSDLAITHEKGEKNTNVQQLRQSNNLDSAGDSVMADFRKSGNEQSTMSSSVLSNSYHHNQQQQQHKHANSFPDWKSTPSSHADGCKCVNFDFSQTPYGDQDHPRRGSRTSNTSITSHLCQACSQSIMSLQNNKRAGGGGGNTNSNSNPNSNTATFRKGQGQDQGNGGDVTSTRASSADPSSPGGGGDSLRKFRAAFNLDVVSQNKQSQIAAIANLLALAALDLTAPASSVLVKNRKNAWIQLAGHAGSFAPAGPKTIWKKRMAKENYETLAYQALSESGLSRDVIPAFYREVEFQGEYFIEMEDLLHNFNDPSIMDIKMGTRTFLEAEVKNPVMRKDLFDKMVKLDMNAPTQEEMDQGAITKLRYMQFRENESSTASLGFRIEAIRMSGEPPNTNLKKVKTRDEVSYFIQNFTKGHEAVLPALHQRFVEIRETFESIPFFNSHEIIGSSLLIMYDNSNRSGIWMIDFAKTIPVTDITVNHRSPWKLGNHEDGYLVGLDNLVDIFKSLSDQLDTSTSLSSNQVKIPT